ncbi:hypothetical protein B0T22DRAFT_204033 [Podospora appendiculata]|uniref:Uncharacterized protein n=1 Tax=Podospora appendiculata TaxID=314037 RepID=A0AAE0X463_9PEZI|nr:hypothetical protein B0T22DRAFT_204033 [Podospora appendiculata]
MDLDIEMDVDDVHETMQIPEAYTIDIITGEEQEPGEVDEEPINDQHDDAHLDKEVVPNKVHLRGLDTFTPEDLKAYLAQHYGDGYFDRIEWIDDSSANLVFKHESIAQEALVALAAIPIGDPTQMPPLEQVRAKDFAAKPDSILQVRFAVASDRKVVGAAARSRFYLLHPEYDPEERRRRGEFSRGKYRDRDDGYRRGGRSGGRRRSREEEEEDPEPFDVNLYDDNPEALAKRVDVRARPRRDSISSSSSEAERIRSYARQNRDKELFPDRRPGSGLRARDRSASPIRERDGDASMDLDEDARNAAALRSREKSRSIKDRLSKESSTRELFPAKANTVKELFPTKVSASSVGGKAQMDQVDHSAVLASAKLADRITPRTSTSAGSSSSAFNIRGIANKRSNDLGFAIKGTGTTAKELFPDRFNTAGNAGKELFADKLEGRGRRRQKAEDSWL